MDEAFLGGSEVRDGAIGTSNVQSQEIVNAPPAMPWLFSSSTPLLAGLPTETHTDTEAQQTSTSLSNEESPSPRTWRETGYVVVIVIAVLAGFTVPAALQESGLDTLYFTKLTWYSIVVCMGASMTLQSLIDRARVREKEIGQTITRGSHIRFLFFVLALLYWGTWLAFYGTIWLWAALRYPPFHQSTLTMNRVWREFQGKMDAPDALAKLTTCLQNALPDRNATIADVTACLKKMGVQDRFEVPEVYG